MGVVAFMVVVGACGTVEPGQQQQQQNSIGGQVRGLWDGADGVALRLEASGVNAILTVPANGGFSFPHKLASGTSYIVTVAGNPANHVCAVESGGNGAIGDADIENVSVACTGPAAEIELSGQWAWAFDATQETQTFAASLLVEDVTLKISGSSLVEARVGGSAAMLGMPTAPIALALGMTMVPVVLTASGRLSRTFKLVFARGAAVMDQVVYGKASNAGTDDGFGYSIALSNDTLAVGAYFESSSTTGINGVESDNGASRSGAVYVFVRSGASWTQQAYIKASNTGVSDNFGRATALSGDTLAVGAWQESSSATGINGNQADNTGLGSGAVYVFVRSGGTWTQQAYVKASNTGAFDFFGNAVALSGDTLAVGALGESSAATGVNGNQADDSAGGAGAVYIFVRTGTTWSQQAYVKASNTGIADGFGSSVALSGDTLAVGAPGEDSAATGIGGNEADNNADSAGAVYMFVRAGTRWTQQAYVKATNANAGDLFGTSLALSGTTLAVGALGEDSAARSIDGDQADNRASEAGAVYVFVRTGTTWMQQAYVKASNTGVNQGFGCSTALWGDVLAVGASQEASAATGIDGSQSDNTTGGAGAVYLFVRGATTWTQQAYAKASNTDRNDAFGTSVALSGDTLVVSAFGESSSALGINPASGQADNASSNAGAIYIFR